MSDRHMFYARDVMIAMRLAAQLGREDAGRFRAADTIADDAAALMRAGQDARRALAGSGSPEEAYAEAAKVAEAYNARVIRSGEAGDVVLGLRFWSGRYGASGAIFRVS